MKMLNPQIILRLSYLTLYSSILTFSFGAEIDPKQQPDLKTQESFDTFSGALGPLRAHLDPIGILKSENYGPSTSYDDFHKYGGIGKKILGSLVHDSDGYKHYHDDSEHLDQGLNKYSGHHQRDKYGGKSGNHKDYHDTHIYTRNRGYGYEKHYMFDKEYSTGKSIGTHNGHHSYYGDHDHGSKMSIDAHKNYESKKFGGKSLHSEYSNEPTMAPIFSNNDYPGYIDGPDYGKSNLLKHKKEFHQLKKHLDHHHHHHLSPPITYAKVHEYVPVIENYDGISPLLGTSTTGLSLPTYGTDIIESVDPHHYYPKSAYIHQQPLSDDTIYLSSSASNAQQKISNNNNRNLDTEGESVNTLSPGPSSLTKMTTSTTRDKMINTAPLISTRLAASVVPSTVPRLTVAESFARIQSAVHATPPVIATRLYRKL